MPPPTTTSGQHLGEGTGLNPLHKVEGLALGIIAGVESGNAKGPGRVQISFPWLDSGMQMWARVAWQPGTTGSTSYQVDDEVIVGFEHGDIRFPYVLGRVG